MEVLTIEILRFRQNIADYLTIFLLGLSCVTWLSEQVGFILMPKLGGPWDVEPQPCKLDVSPTELR